MPYKDIEKRREYQKNRNLKRFYNITIDEYNKMYKKQGGVCKICGFKSNPPFRALHVDHNHKTKEIRGLLCAYCNRKIIGAIEKIGFEKIADYLDYKIIYDKTTTSNTCGCTRPT